MKKWWVLLTALMLALCLCASAEEYFYCDNYHYVLVNNGTAPKTAMITGYSGTAEHLTLPSKLDSYTVTHLGDFALRGHSQLKSVTIPRNIVTVGVNPFMDCVNLREIKVASDHHTLKNAGGALYDTWTDNIIAYPQGSTAESYTIPKGTKYVGNYAFYGSPLTKITLPATAKEIGDYAFASCEKLTAMTIPDSVQTIGEGAYNYCLSLRQIRLPEGLDKLATSVLNSCSALERIDIPDSVRSIGFGAFSGCHRLKEIALPDRLETLSAWAFASCNGLTRVTIPSSVTTITGNPFPDCANLYAVDVAADHPRWLSVVGELYDQVEGRLVCYPPALGETAYFTIDGTKTIGYAAFYGCTNLQELYVGEGVTLLEDMAIASCSVTAVSLPTTLTEIRGSCFIGCEALTNLVIPDQVTTLGSGSFIRCVQLKSVTLPAGVTRIGSDCFVRCPNLTLTVPRDSYAAQWAKDNGVQFMYPDSLDWLTN